MAEASKIDNNHTTSDYLYDPHCEGCRADGRNVEAFGFCDDCDAFICLDCHKVHSRLPLTRHHSVRTGDDMPKGLKEKPLKYLPCKTYVGQINDKFCLNHQQMVCIKCLKEFHTSCEIINIIDVCSLFDAAAHARMVDKMNNIRKNIAINKASVQTNAQKLECERQSMLVEANTLFDKTKSLAEKLLKDIKTDIEKINYDETSTLRDQLTKLNAVDVGIKTCLTDIEFVQQENMDAKMFIHFQETLNKIRSYLKDLDSINNDLKEVDISFTVDDQIQEFLSKCSHFGKISVDANRLLPQGHKKEEENFEIEPIFLKTLSESDIQQCTDKTVPEPGQAGGQNDLLKQVEDLNNKWADARPSAILLRQIPMKISSDTTTCRIVAVDLTHRSEIVVADEENRAVKIFSSEGTFLSAFTVSPNIPASLCVIDNNTLVVSLLGTGIVVVDISNPRAIRRQKGMKIKTCHSLCPCGNNLAMICEFRQAIKLITLTGKVLWSVILTQFKNLCAITTRMDTNGRTIIVADRDTETFIFLKSETGEVIETYRLDARKPRSLSVDKFGRLCVCYESREIDLWSEDLSESQRLVDCIGKTPFAICVNKEKNELLVSYPMCDIIDLYRLI